MIYISHAYGGIPDNIAEVELIIKDLVKRNPGHTFVSPIHCFGFLYSDVPYQVGLDMCLELLAKCEAMWVFGKHSIGVLEEIEYCEVHGIPWEQK